MIRSRLIQTLCTFSAVEWKHFREFIQSTYFNRSGRGLALFDYLDGFQQSWDHPDLTKKKAFQAIFPKKSYHPQDLLDEMSHLFRLAKAFLANEELKAQPEQLELLALAQLRQKQAISVQKTQLNALSKKLEQSPFLDDRQLAFRHQWSEENNLYQYQKSGRSAEDIQEQKIEVLDKWYLYLKLRDSCALLNLKNILEKETQFPLLKEIQDHLDQYPERFADLPALGLYRQVFAMLSEPENKGHYQQFVNSLETHITQLSIEQAKTFYTYAQNVCINRMNRGSSFFSSELFRLYKTQLDNGLLTTGKTLPHTTYTNVVSTALKFQEFEWIEAFMETYKPFLQADTREAVYTHNLAAFYFGQKKWREAIRLLREGTYPDAFYEVSARVMLCKAYFEQEDWEALRYLLDAFKRSLNRNRVLSRTNRTHYLNFLKYLRRISVLREKQPYLTATEFAERNKKVQVALENAENTSNLKWLMAQV